jgi:hypothetical protein
MLGNCKGETSLFASTCGAGNGVRTRDIQLGKLTLYQLSYARSGPPKYNPAYEASLPVV